MPHVKSGLPPGAPRPYGPRGECEGRLAVGSQGLSRLCAQLKSCKVGFATGRSCKVGLATGRSATIRAVAANVRAASPEHRPPTRLGPRPETRSERSEWVDPLRPATLSWQNVMHGGRRAPAARRRVPRGHRCRRGRRAPRAPPCATRERTRPVACGAGPAPRPQPTTTKTRRRQMWTLRGTRGCWRCRTSSTTRSTSL